MRTSIGALRLGTRIQTRYVRLKMEHFVCSIIKPLIIPMVTVEYSKVDILMVDLRINCWLETLQKMLSSVTMQFFPRIYRVVNFGLKQGLESLEWVSIIFQ